MFASFNGASCHQATAQPRLFLVTCVHCPATRSHVSTLVLGRGRRSELVLPTTSKIRAAEHPPSCSRLTLSLLPTLEFVDLVIVFGRLKIPYVFLIMSSSIFIFSVYTCLLHQFLHSTDLSSHFFVDDDMKEI